MMPRMISAMSADSAAMGPAQLLLVDDEANIRRMLSALLREEGFTVLQVTHDLAEAEGAGVRVELEEGRVVG